MTQQLHDELARIGDTAPPVAPAPDVAPHLWRRGRRARTRDRLVAVSAAVAIVVALGGIATAVAGGTPGILPADQPVRDEPGVPTVLSAAPEWVVQLPESETGEVAWAPELDAVSDLAVGQAAAAFAAGDYGRLPVVVTAADGRYLPLELPGFTDAGTINSSNGGDGSTLALSPDGHHLAYAWWNPLAQLDEPMPSGVRVVDLTTGKLTTIELRGGNGIDVERIAWSPNGRWLVWTGDETATWTPMSRSSRDTVSGRARLGSPSSEPLVGAGFNNAPTIADDGTAAFYGGSRVVVSSGEDAERTRVDGVRPGLVAGAVFSADGRTVSLSEGSFGNLPRLHVPSQGVSFTVKPSDYPEATEVRPLGWSADGGLVVVSRTLETDARGRLAIVEEDGNWRDVGEVEPRAVGSLTIATALMTSARPTVDRPAPDWPWSLDRKVAVGCVSAVTLWLTGVFLWTRRRRW